MEGSDEVDGAVGTGKEAEAQAAPRKFASRNDVKVARDREVTEVEVKEWGGFFRIVPMTGEMRAQLEDRVADRYKELPNGKRVKIANPEAKTYRERMLVECVVDEDGAPLFKMSDITWLAQKGARPVTIISQAILKLSGVTPEEQEEIEKNSESATSVAG